MSDVLTLRVVGALTAVATVLMLFDAPILIRLPPVILFSLMAPGLALTRAVPGLSGLERASIVGAVSLSVIVAVSLALVLFNAWAGATTLIGVGMVTLLALRSSKPGPDSPGVSGDAVLDGADRS